MPKADISTIREIERTLEQYKSEIGFSSLSAQTRRTYIQDVERFIRWLKDEYTPPTR
jgi:hypothetical protein